MKINCGNGALYQWRLHLDYPSDCALPRCGLLIAKESESATTSRKSIGIRRLSSYCIRAVQICSDLSRTRVENLCRIAAWHGVFDVN